ncbi:hypothetical protein [Sulfobacillus thermotolerans]|uniref:HflX-like GTP-binding protein n=1 Tax=Sulfobacillus thermotolerans TaxID=338644 RepID=UPI00336885B0
MVRAERVILVGTADKGESARRRGLQELDELALLVEQAGGEVVDRYLQARDNPEVGLGPGALQEVAQRALELDSGVVVSNDDLAFAGLYTAISHALEEFFIDQWLFVPWNDAVVWKRIYQEATIIARHDTEDGSRMLIRAPRAVLPGLIHLSDDL